MCLATAVNEEDAHKRVLATTDSRLEGHAVPPAGIEPTVLSLEPICFIR